MAKKITKEANGDINKVPVMSLPSAPIEDVWYYYKGSYYYWDAETLGYKNAGKKRPTTLPPNSSNLKNNAMTTYNFTVTVNNYDTDADYPSTGAADTLYTNDANDVVKAWDTTNSAYYIYVGPHPHPHH